MSVRTRVNRDRKPGVSSVKKPGRFERRLHHKQVRRYTNMALSQGVELDDVALPRPHSTTVDIEPTHEAAASSTEPKRFKVWKTKAWKRRSNERRRKVRIYNQVLAES